MDFIYKNCITYVSNPKKRFEYEESHVYPRWVNEIISTAEEK